LTHALSDQLASNQIADAPVRVGVSSLSRNGNYRRTFVLRNKSAVAALACRDRDAWRLETLAPTRSPDSVSGGYQAAASSLPKVIAQSVDELIIGEPLDAKAEAAARGNSWQP
jgi:hypothetical protein